MLRDPTPQFMLDTIQGLRNQRLSGKPRTDITP